MTDEEDSGLIGSIKNGLERGESLGDIRMSLLNAGYGSQKVDNAISNFGDVSSESNLENVYSQGGVVQQARGMPSSPPKSSKLKILLIIMIIILLLLITTGVLAFFFKDFFKGLLR
jgi:hypothetical protein